MVVKSVNKVCCQFNYIFYKCSLTACYAVWGGSAEGFPTVIILQLLTSSIIMFSLGIIGFYISKIYEEIKYRPRYIIREKISKEDIEKEK